MATRSWHSPDRPTWRFRLIARLVRSRNAKNSIPAGLPLTGALVLFAVASMVWPVLPMAVAGAGLALILQEVAAPTPLFWTVPWEALQFVLSRQVRANHFWLHRTEELLRGRLTKLDGVATREGFLLIGTTVNETEIQWASQYAWRTMGQKSCAKIKAPGCKTMQFLLALWLIAGGLTLVSLWRGVDLASTLLLSAVCGAAGQLLARPTEKVLGSWPYHAARSNNETWPGRLEVESLAIPQYLWFKKTRVFQVRRMPSRESSEG